MLEQTITIVNNSGKIVSTGKELFSIFKDAKESYIDKKSEIKGLQRAQTFDQTRSINPRGVGRESVHDYDPYRQDRALPRRSFDEHSDTSSRRSYRTSSVRSPKHHSPADAVPRSRPALTAYNLKTHSEVSSVAPSRAPPNAYRSPFAETMTRDLADARSMAVTERQPPGELARRRSLSQLGGTKSLTRSLTRKPKEIDMDLAYGNIPPDLEQMVELDPNHDDGKKATFLVKRVEGVLTEADCLKHSAGAIIKRLQQDPNAAASVALTLTELSKVVAKMSPAILTMLKGSSPAVFGLLASPQFLIGTSIVAGVTVIMFGGWKIVKKVKENQMAREALGYEGAPVGRPAPLRTQSDGGTGYDEALIVDDDISSIETWRRGIAPFGDDASADFELITPHADWAQRHANDDARSRKAKTAKSSRSVKSSRTTRSTREHDREVPERRSSRRSATAESVSGASERSSSSRKKHSSSSSSSSSKGKKKGVRAIEDGRSRRDDAELVLRPKTTQGSSMLKSLFKNKDRERDLVLA